MELTILAEDPDILVVVKPAGIPTQSGRISEPDCVSILKKHLADGRGEPYLGLVHRLDQPVEGIMVFAKNKKAAAALCREAAGTEMEKRYLARLCGVPEQREGTLTSWLCRDARTNSSASVPEGTAGAKKAVLSYRVVSAEEGGLFSLAEIKLQSGRHHQIRVQMAETGHPIDGDRKYGRPDGTGGVLKLCAYHLHFIHPSGGREMDFQIRPSWLAEDVYNGAEEG